MSLPSILDVKPLPSIDTMSIKTEQLEPQTINDRIATFQLPRTGTLDAGSMLTVAVTVPTAAVGKAFFPLVTGANSIIKSATLKVGNKVVAQNDNYAHHRTMMRQFQTPDHRAFIGQIREGSSGDRVAVTGSGRIAFRDLATTLGASENLDAASVPKHIKPTDSDATTPVFSLALSDLIPMMKSRQLPLFAIKDHVYLELEFHSSSDIVCKEDSLADFPAVSISKPNVKFIYDGLYYSEGQEQAVLSAAQSKEGLSFLYEDLITTIASVPSPGQITQKTDQVLERELALSGKQVRSIFVQESTLNGNNILGNFVSGGRNIPSSINYLINDQRVYDRDIDSVTQKYEELSIAAGRPLMVPSQLYSYDADTDKASATEAPSQNSVYIGKIEGHQCPAADNTDKFSETDLRATSSYEGLDLTKDGLNRLGNSTLIGVKPIRLLRTYHRTPEDDRPFTIRAFASVEKVMVIRNGEVMVSA